MKSIIKILFILLFIFLIGLGAKIIFKAPTVTENEIEENVVESEEVEGINIEDLTPVGKVEKNQDKKKVLDQIEEKDKVVLYFFADWCWMCQKISADVDLMIEENRDIDIIKIDTEIEEELKKEFNVTNVPTFIIVKDGAETERIVEVLNMEEIKEFIKK